ncbi:MAG: oxidoreductase [Roseovarius sp.]|nr:oxidoreductase [Roseovarius sp.]MBK44690.1 oxidoreductase [Roseovarius sp.]
MPQMPCRRSVLTAALGAALLVPAPLRAASEDALLIDLRDGSGKLLRRFRLDHAALAALPQTEYVTRTIWTSGPQRFRGVALATLLGHLGIDAAEIELEAANAYRVSLPVAEIGADYPIVAISRNGREMSLRDKGPFWLVYDYDADAAFRTRLIYSRSIWQLVRITARQARR